MLYLLKRQPSDHTHLSIGTILTFIFHSSFQFSSKVEERILLFTLFQCYYEVSRDRNVHNFANSFLRGGGDYYDFIRTGCLAEIRWCVCMIKSHTRLCVSFSWTAAGLCIYHLFVRSHLPFLHVSQWIIMPTQLCLVSYSYCAAFAYYEIDRFISITTWPTCAILLRLIYSCFDVIGSSEFVLCCY